MISIFNAEIFIKTNMKKILILLAMAFAINVAAQESVLLRLNYAKGENYAVEMKMSQDMGTMMSMDMKIQMTQEIKSVTESEYVADMKITKMVMDMNQSGIDVNYDSSMSDDELSESGKIMKAQVGPMLQVVITSKGNNLGEILSTAVEPNIPGASDFADQSSSVVYPKEAVSVGSSWTMSKEDNGMKMDFVYTVKSITNKVVTVDVSGTVTGAAEGTIKGHMGIDSKSGVPMISSIDMDMTVQGQAMKSTVIITMTKK